MTSPRSGWPDGFRWGVATAAYQIEGAHDADGRGPSIWDTYSHTPGMTHKGETGDVTTDHYRRYGEDIGLMRALGVDAYRFSLSWSRLIPEGTGAINPAGIDFYRRLCGELREAGITPVVTLYHWDLPQALQDRGGWLSPEAPGWFAEYAAVAKTHLGDLVDVWTTLNEPWCSAFLGHSAGRHAPGGKDGGDGFVAAHHLMLAHHAGIAALRATAPRPEDELGIVLNTVPVQPASDDPADVAATDAIDAIGNRLFGDAVVYGTYPETVREMHRRFGVDTVIDPEELVAARQDIDVLGFNYYTVNRVRFEDGAAASTEFPGAEGAVVLEPPGRLTEMGWGVEAEGLTWMLQVLANRYPGMPMMICENGAAYPDRVEPDGSIEDRDRIAFLEGHLAAVAAAIDAGVDLRGYFVWSLLDNYEWARGYRMRFGLIRVDYETLERTVKASGWWYRDFIAAARSGT